MAPSISIRSFRTWARWSLGSVVTSAMILCGGATLDAQQTTVVLKNGMEVGTGFFQKISGLEPTGSVNNAGPAGKAIGCLDTGLCRIYFNSNSIATLAPAQSPAKIELANKSEVADASTASVVAHVSSATSTTPFDPYGRRVYTLFQNNGKPATVVQGITEITPNYVKLEGLRADRAFAWDMRLALSAIPPDKLSQILIQNANPNDSQSWLNVVSLYLNAKRYGEARAMLVKAIRKFPELENNRSQLKQIDQLLAVQMFDAVKTAQESGQHQLAQQLLDSFDRSRLSDETNLKIETMLDRIAADTQHRRDIIQSLRDDISKLADPAAKKDCEPILEEISKYMTADMENRFADYERLRSDPKLREDQRVALGIGGWLLGSGLADDNLSVIRSAIAARSMIADYLSAPRRNDQWIEELSKLEAGAPKYVARIVANMAPPLPVADTNAVDWTIPNPTDPQEPTTTIRVPGRYVFEVPLSGKMVGRTVRYAVQLPPEYNPFRRYPCVFTLPSELTSIEGQLQWWTSFDASTDDRRCYGEASRHGYIVISPEWNEPKQPVYNYTENEHACILAPLRDAFRRFSIDTDRVFVSGHFMGADAAWDIAWAHPDLWAGSIMIGGYANKYVLQYFQNAHYVPSYFVNGELEGQNPEQSNGRTWDRILDRHQIDAMVTLYRGRGVDHFQEDLPNIVRWMDLPSHRRNFSPDEFKVTTARAGDRYFWWFETDQLFTQKLVHPLLFKSGSWYEIESKINKESNMINIKHTANHYTIWLSPDLVDFNRKVTLHAGDAKKTFDVRGSTRVLLEDVRGRGDRQHPFWDRVEL